MNTQLSTQSVREKNRLSYWIDVVCNTIINVDIKPLDDQPFFGAITTHPLASIQLSKVSSNRSFTRRSKRSLAKMDKDSFIILFQLSGEASLSQNGRTAHLRPGDWALHSTDCFELTLATDNYQHLLLEVPRPILQSRLPGIDLMTARRFSSQTGLSRITYDLIQSIQGEITTLQPHMGTQLARTFVDLITTDLNETFQLTDPSARNGAITLLEIKSFIQNNLSNPDLSPEMIAQALHISKGHLYARFKPENTTISRYIRDLRLMKCRADLSDPRLIDHSVMDIAFAWGFNSVSHFSNAFKRQYHLSPRAYRHQQFNQS